MILKLNAIDSTNAFMKRLINEKSLDDYTVVVTAKQTEGRGQMGAIWQSEPFKNLIMSVFKRVPYLDVNKQFFLSICVSIAVINTLKNFGIKDLYIKWPNDILSANKKICGILIETVIKEGAMYSAIAGIGLNVNQVTFPGLPNATSMNKLTERVFDIDMILHELLKQLKYSGGMLESENSRKELKAIYLQYLFRLNKPSTFEDNSGKRFMGLIKGVDDTGKLIILLEDDTSKAYDIKEIKLLY